MDSLVEQIKEIKAKDHLCLIYETELEWKKTVSTFLVSGLERGEKCIYINSEYSNDYVRNCLSELDVAVDEIEEKGQLEFIDFESESSSESRQALHLKINFLEEKIKKALAEGYSGLRITGEVPLNQTEINQAEEIIDYEISSNLFFEYPLAMLCRYNLNSLSAHAIREVIRLHSYIIWQEEIYRNPIYITPEKLKLKRSSSKAELVDWLENIKEFNNLKNCYQNKLAKRQKELEEKNQELKDLLYITSHDLRSPLINVQGFSQEIKLFSQQGQELITKIDSETEATKELETILTKEIPEAVNYIKDSSEQMNTLLNGLLKLSRLKNSKLNWEKININQLLTEILSNFEYRLQQKEIEVEIDDLFDCQGDSLKLKRVFSNIIDNAIKYLPDNQEGIIKISSYKKEDKVVYTIKDNGSGIKKSEQKEIFSIFNRGSNNQDKTGSGMGLAIVKQIVDLHNGSIDLESELDKGAEFYITLAQAKAGD